MDIFLKACPIFLSVLILNFYTISNTVIVEIFGGFNFGHFRISPEFLGFNFVILACAI